jgi:hypothetical protein
MLEALYPAIERTFRDTGLFGTLGHRFPEKHQWPDRLVALSCSGHSKSGTNRFQSWVGSTRFLFRHLLVLMAFPLLLHIGL